MARGKAGLDEGKEGAGHVGLHPLVVGGVEPGHSALSASPPGLVSLLVHPGGCVGELVLVASLGERLLVRGDCASKIAWLEEMSESLLLTPSAVQWDVPYDGIF